MSVKQLVSEMKFLYFQSCVVLSQLFKDLRQTSDMKSRRFSVGTFVIVYFLMLI